MQVFLSHFKNDYSGILWSFCEAVTAAGHVLRRIGIISTQFLTLERLFRCGLHAATGKLSYLIQQRQAIWVLFLSTAQKKTTKKVPGHCRHASGISCGASSRALAGAIKLPYRLNLSISGP